MTAVSDTSEIDQLKARDQELSEENLGLASEIEDLHYQLADTRCITPYDQPGDVLKVLTMLPGWPARRWDELVSLIEQKAIPGSRS
jgi:hypothetical protein